MFISMWMTADPICIPPNTPLPQVSNIFQENSIRRLLVTDPHSDQLVGIVSTSDLAQSGLSSEELGGGGNNREVPHTVSRIMTPDPITLDNHDSVAKAALIMRTRKIGAIPVLRKGKLVGIITESDVLDSFVSMLVCGEDSVTITIDVANATEEWLSDLVKFSTRARRKLLSVSYLEHDGKSVAVVRLSGRKSEAFVSRLWKAGLPVLSILVEDGKF